MSSTGTPFGVLHHIGIAVPSIPEPERALCALLGGGVIDAGEDEQLAVGWSWIASPSNPVIELLAPLNADSTLARDLRRRGSGLHHVSFRPEDLGAAKHHVERCCLPVIGENPDHGGYEEFFIHPSATGGALLHAFRELAGTNA